MIPSIYDQNSALTFSDNINTPPIISDLAVWRSSPYNFRGHNKAVVPRLFTYFLKISICYRDVALWNRVSDYFNDSCRFKQF